MVNAQEWLDQNYPKEGWKEEWEDYSRNWNGQKKEWRTRSEVEQIYITEPNLEGELDLEGFIHKQGWEIKIYISFQVDETKLTFKNQGENVEIKKCVEAQKWLDKNYPKNGTCIRKGKWNNGKYYKEENHQDFGKTRSEITGLDIRNKNLEGNLSLSGFTNLKTFYCPHNKLTSLECSNCEQLEVFCCSNNSLTSIILPTNPTNLEKLYLENNNFSNQGLINNCGSCPKCYQPNTSKNWCQPCAEKEWIGLEGQELVKKFIQQQQLRESGRDKKLQWIPYEEFTDVEFLTQGGFGKVYKARYLKGMYSDGSGKDIILKSLTNSQNITPEFLTEITNTKLVDYSGSSVVKCYAISQDPQTKNYVIVMGYANEGNLRQYLQNKNNDRLSLKNKLERLSGIANGLKSIHNQNLAHRDFHSGNILNNSANDRWGRKHFSTSISDLGLSCLVNSQKQEGKIFGVLPYVAPEVLQGQTIHQEVRCLFFWDNCLWIIG